jgi:hypothetical protein
MPKEEHAASNTKTIDQHQSGRNRAYERLTPESAVLLLIGHQAGPVSSWSGIAGPRLRGQNMPHTPITSASASVRPASWTGGSLGNGPDANLSPPARRHAPTRGSAAGNKKVARFRQYRTNP